MDPRCLTDPLRELEDSLAYMFELQAKKDGGYIDPLVNKLRMALDNYKEKASSNSLQNLMTAIKNASPIIEKYYVDSYEVRRKIEALAGTQGESINWYTTRTSSYRFFQPFKTNRDSKNDFILWLSSRNKNFESLDGEAQVEILIKEKSASDKEFKKRLNMYLRANPDFLANLAMESPKSFIKLMSNNYLEHQLKKSQIAKAIYHHGKTILESLELDKSLEPIDKVIQLVRYLNNQLSKLHSIEKLLEDPKAKAVLDQSELFQIYQCDEYQQQQGHSTAPVA